jgi:hypothetical protein
MITSCKWNHLERRQRENVCKSIKWRFIQIPRGLGVSLSPSPSLSRLSRSARNFRERFVCVSRPKSRKPKAASLKYLHKPDKLSHFKRLTIKNEQCLFKQPPSSDSLLELTHSTQLDSAKWRQSDEKAPRARVLDSPRQF